MPLPSGTRIGSYEIVGTLGAGGMGEVYRATDTHLGREVAIKVLPDAVAQDPERLARFEREARTLASLSHPNIAIVHGFEKAAAGDGQAPVHAIVMELVEGEGLDEKIAAAARPTGGAGLALAECLAIAAQISAALEAAHEQGIIHRDLKPANIKVTPDGHVKVLDFGLAKSGATGATGAPGATGATGAPGAAGATGAVRFTGAEPAFESPTITSPAALTINGMILGTAAYMSPEQAKGRAADKRSDVWAFGCVLYEMLTGRRAFAGEDVSDTLASILKSDPDWTALPLETPPAIRALLERCLMRDRRHRIGDLAAASFVLRGTAALDATLESAHARIASNAGASRRGWLAPVVAALATAAIVAFGAWMLWPVPSTPAVVRFAVPASEALGARLADTRSVLALSPDGRHLAWMAPKGIALWSLESAAGRIVPGTEGGAMPAFSPDGAWMAFLRSEDRTIRRVALTGGSATIVCEIGDAGLNDSLSWDAPGEILFAQGASVYRCADGGAARALTTVDDGDLVGGARLLPGGRAVLLAIATRGDSGRQQRWDEASIVVQPLPSGTPRTLISGGSDPRYVSTGHVLYAREGMVYAVPFDLERMEVTGEEVMVIEGVSRGAGSVTGIAQLALSDSGALAYVPGPARAVTSLVLVTTDRSGTITPLKAPPARYVHVRASPDGTLLAVDIDNEKDADVSTLDLAGTSAMRRLTFGGRNRFPVWSPDGQRLAFQSDRDGDLAIFAQRVDGTGVQRLTKPGEGEAHIPESWSPDGRYLSFAVAKGGEFTLWTLSLPDGATARFREIRSTEPIGSVFSPDGRWIAYYMRPPEAAQRSASRGTFVEPFPPTGAVYQAPKVLLDFQPVWSRDGAELFYVGSTVRGQLAVVPMMAKSGITFGPVTTFPFVAHAGRLSGATRAFDVLPAGNLVGVVSELSQERSGQTGIQVVVNWHEELKRLVPTR